MMEQNSMKQIALEQQIKPFIMQGSTQTTGLRVKRFVDQG
jgi:hypothetical protein